MLTKAGGKVDGVVAANDGLAQRGHHRAQEEQPQRQVPVTGQDATPEGLQNILAATSA